MTAVLDRPGDEVTVVRFEPRGAAKQLWTTRDSVVIMCGPTGTGKTLAALWKLHFVALQRPKSKGLIVRQTHASLTGTTLVSFDEEVIAEALLNGTVKWFGGSARKPPAYIYSNGSTITIGGLDKPVKWMGGQYDRVVVDEATEISTTALEALITRMRAKANTFKQIILCCNPDHPKHWLYTRAQEGKLPMLHSRHQDNPRYFDRTVEKDGTERFEMTAEGRDYIEGKLGLLTGVRRLRYLLGQWASAEGVVFDEFDAAVHLIDDMPKGWESWTRWWTVDFGYGNPFVWQCWAQDGDGRLYLYREIYMSKRLVEDHARQILGIVAPGGTKNSDGILRAGTWIEPKPQAIICDHDAEDRATLERHLGMTTRAAKKAPKAGQRDLVGLQATQARYKVQPDGKPRIFFLRGCTVELDRELKDAGKPTSTVDELSCYVWPPDVKPEQREHPVKENDHGADATRYLCAELDKGQTKWMRWVA